MDDKAVQEVFDSIVPLKDKKEEFISALLDVRSDYSISTKDYNKSVQSVVLKADIDLIEAINFSIEKFNIFELADLFSAVLPIANTKSSGAILDFLSLHAEKTQKDMANGFLIQPLTDRAKEDTPFARAIIDNILTRKDSRLYSYLLSLYTASSHADPLQTFNQFLEFTEAEDPSLGAVGLRGIGLISNLDDECIDFAIVLLLFYIHVNDDEASVQNAVFSICRLTQVRRDILNEVYELTTLKLPLINFEILSFFRFKKDTWQENEIKILTNILDYNLQFKGMNQCFDSILYHIVLGHSYDLSIKIVSDWVQTHSLKDLRNEEIGDILPLTLSQLPSHPDFLRTLITVWLNSDDIKHHIVLKQLISNLFVHGRKTLSLDSKLISQMNYEDMLYIVRKILGYVIEFDTIFSLTLSIFEKVNLSKEEGDLIVSVMIDHIGYNFLQRTIKALESNLAVSTEETMKTQILKHCLKTLMKNRETLQTIKRINELLPNMDNRLKINKSDRKNMSKAMKESRQKSPLLSIIPTVYIKEGLSTFSYHSDLGGYTIPGEKMKCISTTMELPKKDVLDEVGASMSRFGFRQAKRGEV